MSGRDSNEEREIARIKERLARLEEEKQRLTTELNRLLRRTPDPRLELMVKEATVSDEVHHHSSADEKIWLFRSLFRGREDVYPRRWESMKTGRSGYSPACRHEWVPGICEKP
ncbi:MAG: restriction endonuclease subunit R, partial [Bacteroidetes bacterium]|nr:restriction endonuclease subunit R [Bacteroidota bacterium]